MSRVSNSFFQVDHTRGRRSAAVLTDSTPVMGSANSARSCTTRESARAVCAVGQPQPEVGAWAVLVKRAALEPLVAAANPVGHRKAEHERRRRRRQAGRRRRSCSSMAASSIALALFARVGCVCGGGGHRRAHIAHDEPGACTRALSSSYCTLLPAARALMFLDGSLIALRPSGANLWPSIVFHSGACGAFSRMTWRSGGQRRARVSN